LSVSFVITTKRVKYQGEFSSQKAGQPSPWNRTTPQSSRINYGSRHPKPKESY